MEHRRPRVNTTSPIMSKMIIIKTQKQPTKVIITRSLDANITTTRVETVIELNMDVVKMGIIIKSTTIWVVDWVES